MSIIHPQVRAQLDAAAADPLGYWERAADRLPWFRKWDDVFERDGASFRWFVGARTNAAYNCLDRHVAASAGDRVALIYQNERGLRQVWTYAQLLREVERVAAGLRALGVGCGDRVAIYMPNSLEAVTVMLACWRIGAIHIVVFAGFAAGALAERVRLAEAKVLFCCDLTWRKGKEVPLWGIVTDALASTPSVERTVVLRRDATTALQDGRDTSWEAFLALGAGHSGAHVELESNHPAYILATSGTTAKPKLAVHTHGAYQVLVHTMGDCMFGLRPHDVWWATSDLGWAVGHAYTVCGPLLIGCASVVYEGALDFPDTQQFYRILDENRVSGLFTSPTAVRMLMRHGTEPARSFDLRCVERVFCAGETLNPPALEWLQRELFEDRIAVVDHYWQTETSGPVVGNPYGIGLSPIKPGSAGFVLPGIDGAIVNLDGEEVPAGKKGIFVLQRPFPGLTASLWGEPQRYTDDYWRRVPHHDYYFSGDAAHRDEDGYIWFSGRADEILKIAAHRLGTIEVETAFLRHGAVAEAGVCGRPDDLRGEVIAAFVVLKPGHAPSAELRRELLDTVRRELGAVAVIGEMHLVGTLPKTRSGKIMRRVLKAVVTGQEPGDISTIEDAGSVEEARAAWSQMTAQIRAEM